ncbi:MAG: sulfatase-like hydrolase/transferase [Opitutaceae bacterium]
MKQKPNILFILTDQQATHTLGCYGAPVARSPHIDRVAADGVRFDRAYTPCALCTPARASLLTGLYPHNHGALFNTGAYSRFSEEQTGQGLATYPPLLRRGGYHTAYTGKWHAGITRTAADLGLEGFSLPDYGAIRMDPGYLGHLERIGQTAPRRHIEFVAEGGQPEASGGNTSGWISGTVESSPCHYITDLTIEHLENRTSEGEPWFMAVNFWEPHAPYLPTEDYRDLYDPAAIREWASFRDNLDGRPALHRMLREDIFPAAASASWVEWSRVISRYYAQAAMVDFQVGRLMDWLRTKGLYDDCLIVFSSDHGESIGVHGGAFDKGGMAYEEIYRIPLIVKLPGGRHSGESRQSLVSLFDLAPTFCDCAGNSLDGIDARSLWPVLDHGDCEGRSFLLSEDHGHRVPFGQRILWGDRYKYVWNLSDTDELHDLAEDPAELHNRIADPGLDDIREEFRAELLRQITTNHDRLGPQVTQMLKKERFRVS